MMKKKYYNNRLTMSKGSMNMKIIKVINDEDKKKRLNRYIGDMFIYSTLMMSI